MGTKGIQIATGSTRLFVKSSLDLYNKFGYSKYQVDFFARCTTNKGLTERSKGNLKMLPILEDFSSDGFDFKLKILNRDESN